MEKKIKETLFKLTGEEVSENTNLLSLATKKDIGVGDLIGLLCEDLDVRICNNSFPQTVGEIRIK